MFGILFLRLENIRKVLFPALNVSRQIKGKRGDHDCSLAKHSPKCSNCCQPTAGFFPLPKKFMRFCCPSWYNLLQKKLFDMMKIFWFCPISASIPLQRPVYSLLYLAWCYKNVKKGPVSVVREEKYD